MHHEKMKEELLFHHNFVDANPIGGHIHNQGTQKDGLIEKRL
jgi:hypothetical protein